MKKKIRNKYLKKISDLENIIKNLDTELQKKNKLIKETDQLRIIYINEIKKIKDKQVEYNELINEIKEMKNILSHDIFHGKWKIIKFIIKYF